MKNKIKKPKVSILIAALNEEKNIQKTIKECTTLSQYDLEVFVVIDSKTTDNTAEVSKRLGAHVIHTGKWKGKGNALKYAQKKVTGEYIVQIDGDYQFLPRDIPKLITPLQKGYDVSLGTRYRNGAHVEQDSVTPIRRFGIFFLSFVTSLFCRQMITDVLAGFKAFRKEVLFSIDFQETHYGYEAEEVIIAAQKGYKIIDVPITYKKRLHGNSNVFPFKHGFLFLWTIIKVGLHIQR